MALLQQTPRFSLYHPLRFLSLSWGDMQHCKSLNSLIEHLSGMLVLPPHGPYQYCVSLYSSQPGTKREFSHSAFPPNREHSRRPSITPNDSVLQRI